MGYGYIAAGGLARSNTRTLRDVVVAIRDAGPAEVRVHVFGVARLALLPLFLELGITSVDSAAPLRQAWLSARENYYVLAGSYAAIRIPIATQERPKGQTLVGRSTVSLDVLEQAEREALAAVCAHDRGELKLQASLDAVIAYDELLASRLDANNSPRRWELYRRTLRDRPWKKGRCPICSEIGVETSILDAADHSLRDLQRDSRDSGAHQQRPPSRLPSPVDSARSLPGRLGR